MPVKNKGVRVWVAAYKDNGQTVAMRWWHTKREALCWVGVGRASNLTIRRATLILDPVKPKKRRKE